MTSPPSPGSWSALARLGALVASLFVLAAALVLGEWLLRLARPDYLREISANDLNYLHRYSEVYGWEPKRGFSYQLGGKLVAINEDGYRGRRVPMTRTPGLRRVVVLGDSIAFGYGVRDDQTFPHRLDEIDPRLEVVNLAVQGYGTDQALIKLEREALAFRPDLVILAFCVSNDFHDNSQRRFRYDERYPKPAFVAESGSLRRIDAHLRLGPLDRLVFFLVQESALYNLAMEAFGVEPAGRSPAPRVISPVKESEIPLTLRLLKEMDRVARAHGTRFLLLVFPDWKSFDPSSPVLQRMRESPLLAEVDVIDMVDEYARRGVTREQFGQIALDRVLHLSPRGHRLTAEIVRDLLASRWPDAQ